MKRVLLIGIATLALVGGLALAIGALVARARASSDGLPYYSEASLTPRWDGTAHRVAPFSLVSQTGAAFGGRDLAGRVYVASFIYTRCSVVCPQLVSSLKRVQRSLDAPNFDIVSFSVTPDLDPPAVLAGFGRERGIDPSRWHLLTGDKSVIYALARDSYFANDQSLRNSIASDDGFLHTEKLVLVDQVGRLRGVYDGTVPRDVDLVIADAKALVRAR